MAAKKAAKPKVATPPKGKKPSTASAPPSIDLLAQSGAPTACVSAIESTSTPGSIAEKRRRIAALRNANPGVFLTPEELGSQYMLRRPTGIIELDIHLAGGFPAGGASCLSGMYNSGKSWLLWRMFAMQQRICGNDACLAIAHPEGPLDYKHIMEVGVRIRVPDTVIENWDRWRRLHHLPSYTGHELDYFKYQIGDIHTIQGKSGEDFLKGVLKFVDTDAFSLIGVDSISALQPDADASKDMDEAAKMGAHAQMMKQFWLRYMPQTRIGRNQTTVMFVQQVVANTGKANLPSYMQKFAPDTTVKGAESTKHAKLIDLSLEGKEKIRTGADNKEIEGKHVRYTTIKGKAGVHDNISGEFAYYYRLHGIDMAGDLITSGMLRGIIRSHGDKLLAVRQNGSDLLDPEQFQNDKALRARIEGDVVFEMALRQEIMASAGVQCLFR